MSPNMHVGLQEQLQRLNLFHVLIFLYDDHENCIGLESDAPIK